VNSKFEIIKKNILKKIPFIYLFFHFGEIFAQKENNGCT